MPPSVAHVTLADGRRSLRAEVVWVDRFGNLQLGATLADAEEAQLPGTGSGVELTVAGLTVAARPLHPVATFADLVPGQLGLLLDSNGHLAVVAGQASASAILSIGAGDTVTLTW